MQPQDIIVADAPKAQGQLADLFPDEIDFFKQRFVWSSNTKGFYTRIAYELFETGSFTLPKRMPFKARGHWQPLYPELVDSLVEKHLSFERFCRTCDPRDRLAPRDYETAFWFGTMAGRWTFTNCIDIDNHDTIGWVAIPSRWHQSKTGYLDGPYSYRYIPVPRPSLRFLQISKLVHDHFPGRIWAFSSASFGLGVWDIPNHREPSVAVHRRTRNLLSRIGLDWLECYPQPATGDSFGRCHRRPCGMDSVIIASDGLITEPIKQIRAFMQPSATPDFARIADAVISQLATVYEKFVTCGEGHDHERLSPEERQSRVDSCHAVIEQVRGWMDDGCPVDIDIVCTTNDVAEKPEPVQVATPCEIPSDDNAVYPDCFWQVDVRAVAKSRQWVQFVKFLVETGFPCEDRFAEVVSTLALWFGFVELHGQEKDRVRQVIRAFVLNCHNGNITRLNKGKTAEVLAHVDRIVDRVLDKEDHDGVAFPELRRKQKSGYYQHNYHFEPQILSKARQVPLPNTTTDKPPLHLLCGILNRPSEQENWTYHPELTPLPDEVNNRVKQAFQQANRQLRRNKQTGRYPTLDAITRFFNYLLSGRIPGTRRASRELLMQMGFPKPNGPRRKILDILVTGGLLHRGPYRMRNRSRTWSLHWTVLEVMAQSREANHGKLRL
jgi:hypothetical protein